MGLVNDNYGLENEKLSLAESLNCLKHMVNNKMTENFYLQINFGLSPNPSKYIEIRFNAAHDEAAFEAMTADWLSTEIEYEEFARLLEYASVDGITISR